MKFIWLKLVILGLCLFLTYKLRPVSITLTKAEVKKVGQLILFNECGGKLENLVFWNEAEDFPSLGIGHFIWFPQHKNIQFEQTFPELITFLKKHTKVPHWLAQSKGHTFCPWNTRSEFLAAAGSKKMKELKTLLLGTIDLQAEFIVRRFEQSLIPLVKRFPKIKPQVIRLLNTPGGVTAMIDYANFKGLGLNPVEQYNNIGWGLVHVLEGMKGKQAGKQALNDFVDNAQRLLELRVKNTPPNKDERRFLPGWFNRLERYRV